MLRAAKPRIIGCLLVLLAVVLGGCSTVRLAYSNGPQLAWWWLDGYVDFSRDQAPLARQTLDRWFDWHRSTQLTGYATLLAQAQLQVADPLTPAQACQWQARGRAGLEPALQRAADDFAALAPGLGEAQFRQLQQRYDKGNQELQEEYLQPDPEDRQRARFKRTLGRAEMLYGDLGDAQKRLLESGLASSPFDPQAWLQDRQRRQRDTLKTLRDLVARQAGDDERRASMRALAKRLESSSDPAYERYQRRVVDHNCELAARLHNATTQAQRQNARSMLQGWEADLRWLAANPANSSTTTSAQAVGPTVIP